MILLENEILKKKYLKYALTLTKDIEAAKELISEMVITVYEKKDMFDKANEGGYIEGYLISTIYHLFCKSKRINPTEELDSSIAVEVAEESVNVLHLIERINRDKRKKKQYFKVCYSTFTLTDMMVLHPSWRATATSMLEPYNMQSSNINIS
jgi:hypothetical protein